VAYAGLVVEWFCGACVMTTAALSPVAAARARLYELSDEYARDASKNKHSCARSREWALLLLEHRMAVMLLAGLDGDLSGLARRAWPEFTPSEKTAVQVAIRGLHNGLGQSFALRGRAV